MGNTFTWIGGSAYATITSDWLLGAGTGTLPNTGNTEIITSGTVLMPPDAIFSSNTIEIAGTGGIAAALVTNGDGPITLSNPTVDQATTIESQVPGQSAAGTTVLDALGTFVNQGTIEANGTLGSTFTIDVQTGTAGNPGIFINESEIDVAAGNAMTIAVGPNAAFYNASLIQVAGGSLDITTIGTGQFDGGYAPERGVVVISQGGTVEDNTAYGPTVGGAAPYFAFADNAHNLLKIDQPAQFGGRILGFAAGDTIDLGASLAVAGVSYDAATGILALENGGGTTVASLAFVSGAFQTGSFAVSGTTAGSFGITTGSTDTVITTRATNEVWNSGTGGVFTAGSNWVGGVAPGASSAVVIGVGAGSVAGSITTAGSIAVQSLMFVGNSDSLVVSGSLGVSAGPLVQGGGTIEVTNGSTLGVTALSQVGGGALLLDSGALMTVSGHPNFGYANNGSISVAPGAGYGVLLQGTALINAATLLSSASFNIGTDGSGTPAQVTVTAGGVVRDTFASLNSGPTSFGALTLSGTGTSWTDSGDSTSSLNPYGYMVVGYNDIGAPVPFSGAASLSVSNGAILTDAAYARIAVGSNSAGVANIGSGGVWDIGLANGGYLDVGFYGRGTLDIAAGGSVAVGGVGTFVTGGGTYTAGGIGIGLVSGSSGMLNVNGGMLSSAAGIGVGESGTGLLAVENGGTVAVRNGIGIGTSPTGSGTVTVSGGTIDVAGGSIAVGKFGSGVLSISDGGIVTIDSYNLYIGGSPSGPSPGAVGLVTLQSGTTGIGGTLGVADNAYVWAGSTLAVDSQSGVDIGGSGSFVAGAVLIDAGHVLTGDGVLAANLVDNGTVLATNAGSGGTPNGGTLEITGALSGTGTVVLDSGATVRLDGALNSGPGFAFTAGAPETLNLGNYAPTIIANAITGMSGGDRIEFGGPGTIASAVLNGTTLSVVEVSNGIYFGYRLTGVTTQQGTSPNFLTGIDLATGNAYVQLAGNDVWQWINPGTGAATIASNWTLQSGSTANAGYPGPGDTAIVPFGTVILPQDAHLTANTIELGGTASVTAAAVFSGDTAATYLTPTTDAATLIEAQVQGQSTAATSLLDIAGRFVNQGSIAANGTTGSSFTIDVTQGSSGVAGALINYGEIDVAAGNAMTIAAGPTAAFFNAGLVQIRGGYLDLTASGAGAIDGGVAPGAGIYVLQGSSGGGGTLEVNGGFPTGANGTAPLVAFANSNGNLLKLDQPNGFGWKVLGFGAGNTIDLGAVQVGTLVYNTDGLLTLENATGTTVASMVLASGAFGVGTFSVGGSIVAGFTITGNGTDTRLTTGAAGFDQWNGSAGTFTSSGTNWSSGTVAAAGDTALIASNGSSAYVVSSGTGSLTLNGLVVADNGASLQIADAMTVTPSVVQQINGTIEVLGGASLLASGLRQSQADTALLLDQGASVDLTGHPNFGFAPSGAATLSSNGTFGLLVTGSAVVTGAVLNAGAGSGGAGGLINIGGDGAGTPASMLVQNGGIFAGATVTDTYAVLASDPTSFGSLTISGAQTSWTDAGDSADTQNTRGNMIVGYNNSTSLAPYAGAAQLTVTNSATLTETSFATIGDSIDSAGSVTVSDYGVWNIGTGTNQPGFLNVGRVGVGSLLITDTGGSNGGIVAVGGGGTIVTQGTSHPVPYAVDIGANAGAAGSVTVSGGALSSPPAAGVASATTSTSPPPPRGSTLTAAGQINVGDLGSGTLQVMGGGLVDVTTASGIVLGNQAGGIGGVLVDHSVFEATSGSLVVGLGGTGALAIQNSGQAYFATASVKNVVLLQGGGILDVSAGLTVEAGGWVGGGTAARINATGATGTVTNLGTIEATTGALGVNGTLAGNGTMQIDAGATMVVGGSIAGTDTFVFASGAAPAVLDFVATGPTLANGILNLQAGDQIVLENFSTITGATVAGSTITVTGTLTGGTGSSSVELTNVTFAPGVAQNFTTATATDPFSGAAAQGIQLACFAAGTPIATAAGETPVERLRPGDLIRTASGALRPVRWIGHRRIDLTRHPDPRRARPIRVGADAIADGAPTRDVLLSPDHAILYRGGLIPVRLLVNDSTIRRETRTRAVTYYHVELDSHDVLLAAGLAVESYLDTGNRGIFANADDHPLVLHPDFLTLGDQEQREARSCAPFIADPARAEAAWRALADRALALGCPPPEPALTADPALGLRIGTQRVRALRQEGACFRFALPAGAAAVLVSRAAYPQDARPWEEDQRRLGVMVRRLTLHRNGIATDLPLDHPEIGRGWWAPESDGAASWRWTDGAATLPVLDEAAELTVELAGTPAYPLPGRGAVRNPDRRSAAAG